ncbi:hypothetical protein [Kutzneria sp. CA-103260]|uniref:hypothetical protein n=1 Tax=Kutzneria sp. CA-103260 TaxID=2802641 RepID=UPI001BAD02F7|nr:hypothetical protein [Kutzneria sp. CA-103260]QUQ66845.1 hypothetical protein JJ691_45730 [Kutzneria sp. CA-103260]
MHTSTAAACRSALAPASRRPRLGRTRNAGSLAVGFTFQRDAEPQPAPDAWLILRAGEILLYSRDIAFDAVAQAAASRMIAEELHLSEATVRFSSGHALHTVGVPCGIALRKAAASAYWGLHRDAAALLNVPARALASDNGRFRVRGGLRRVSYHQLLEATTTVLSLDSRVPLVSNHDYLADYVAPASAVLSSTSFSSQGAGRFSGYLRDEIRRDDEAPTGVLARIGA